jgi:hypothetical protein
VRKNGNNLPYMRKKDLKNYFYIKNPGKNFKKRIKGTYLASGKMGLRPGKHHQHVRDVGYKFQWLR